MALKNPPVPIPENKVTYKNGNNQQTKYVYYTVRAYRNENGKSTSDEVLIGKKAETEGQMIPNQRYYEIFEKKDNLTSSKTTDAEPERILNAGSAYVLEEIATQTGLAEILADCFPGKWKQMLACAFYMVCEGNTMAYISDWFDENRPKNMEPMDDRECSRLFASITAEERRGFFHEWIRNRKEKEYISYDVTSVSTYSDNIEIAEWGYNRDEESLPQINFGMFYGMTSHVPVYYEIYSGSVPDKECLDYMMANANEYGIRDVCFVIDRGFVTEDNISSVSDYKYKFITSMPGNLTMAAKLVDGHGHKIRKSANRLSELGIYGVQVPVGIFGYDLQAYIYLDPEKQAQDEKEIYAHIEKLRRELDKTGKSRRAPKRYLDYFKIDGNTESSFTYELDTDKIDMLINRAGFFILLSNIPELSSEKAIEIYRNRDMVEKHFDQLKNFLDFKRLRTHWLKTTEGKVFVGFLALILQSHMRWLLKKDATVKSLTFKKVLIELRKIKKVVMSDLREVLIPLTKLQKMILCSLCVPVDPLYD